MFNLSGKNLQICFVNDAAGGDGDSLSSDSESCPNLSKAATNNGHSSSRHSNTTIAQPNPYNSRPLSMKKTASQEKGTMPKTTYLNFSELIFSFSTVRSSALTLDALKTDEDPKEIDFFTKQARLQIEARMALAQAKDIAHMQMEVNILSNQFDKNLKIKCLHLLKLYIHFFSDGTSKTNGISNYQYDSRYYSKGWIQFSRWKTSGFTPNVNRYECCTIANHRQ